MEPTIVNEGNGLKYVLWIINLMLVSAFVAALVLPEYSDNLDAGMLVLSALASVVALNRQLPLQNILLATAVTALFGGFAHGLSARTGIPFGPVHFNAAAGPKLFKMLPWTIPFLWVVAIFTARGVGRLILRPWRKVKTYGFWLIGLTAVLATAFDFCLEPLAAGSGHFWRWQPTRIAITWAGATPVNFLGWAFVTLLILAFITPPLIRKQPGGPSWPDLNPLGVWLGALTLFAAGSAAAGFWGAAASDAMIAAVTTIFAVRGARW